MGVVEIIKTWCDCEGIYSSPPASNFNLDAPGSAKSFVADSHRKRTNFYQTLRKRPNLLRCGNCYVTHNLFIY